MSTSDAHPVALATVLALTAWGGGVACRNAEGGARAASAVATKSTGVREATSALGSYIVRLQSTPDAVPLNEMFKVRLEIRPAGATVATPISVAVDAVMPTHGHGMNTRPSVVSSDGSHDVDGLLFHMPGDWQLWVDITAQGQTERVRFDFTIP